MRAPSHAAQTSRVAIAATLLVVLSTVLSGCAGSRQSDEQRFATAVKAACTSYAGEIRRISRREHKNPAKAAAVGISTADFQAEQRWLEQLRQLSPPASTGVTVSAWRNAIDVQLRDARAAVALYGTEFAKVMRSWKQPPPAPKLPPGTGPTAAILAQAFNSPEGRRFVRLQNRLFKQLQTDAPDWERILKAVGLLKTCREQGTSQASATTTQTTTTTRP